MDTVEELGGTYFYAGMERLGAGELFFWVFVDKTMQQLGVGDVGAVAAIVSGMAILPTRQKPPRRSRCCHARVFQPDLRSANLLTVCRHRSLTHPLRG